MEGLKWDPEGLSRKQQNRFGLQQKALLLKDQSHTKAAAVVQRDFTRQMNRNSKFGVSILAHPCKGELLPFEKKEITIITAAASWGSYKDNIIVSIGDLEPIKMPVHISIQITDMKHLKYLTL